MTEAERNKLAEKIASMLSAGSDDDLRAALDSIGRRLDALESPSPARPAFAATASDHPSIQRFQSLGEIADVIIDRLNNQKECPYEPAGKPCDNCSMCSSRGF